MSVLEAVVLIIIAGMMFIGTILARKQGADEYYLVTYALITAVFMGGLLEVIHQRVVGTLLTAIVTAVLLNRGKPK